MNIQIVNTSAKAAVANYKTGEIRSMIQEAARMSQEAA